MKKERYVAYDQPMRMHDVGERYETENATGEWEWYELFATVEEAKSWVDSRKAEIEARGDAYEITDTKRGLDTLEYHDLIVSKEVWDEDAEDWVFAEEDPVYAIDTVPENVREAARASERSYWKYLDYEASEYHGIRYYLDA